MQNHMSDATTSLSCPISKKYTCNRDGYFAHILSFGMQNLFDNMIYGFAQFGYHGLLIRRQYCDNTYRLNAYGHSVAQ